MFTYLCSTVSCATSSTNVQEADIEVLTNGPRDKIQLTNQPSESPDGDTLSQATLNATLPHGTDWTAWNEYRYDWLPGLSTWYVNGSRVGSISFQAPKDPAGLILNMWSNGGSWTGTMSVGDSSYLQIQWIEIAYNTSNPTSGSHLVAPDPEVSERSSILSPLKARRLGCFEKFFAYFHWERNNSRLIRRSNSKSCHTICSIDINVTTIGTPAVLSTARRQATQNINPLIATILSIGVWLAWL